MTTPASLSCPKCGAALAADSPEGLCPRCLAAASLVGETELPGDEAAPAAPISLEEIAPHFPQLEILSCLGRGGMGIVYKARQKSLNRLVALKLLAPERVHDAAFAERFAREAQALAALSHPGIVTVYDFGEAGRFFFLLMEFVDGVNLRQAMQAGRFTPEQALAIVPPVCEALQFAHEHGIVHRDIKPENLLLDKAGHVKIADFGIAKMLNVEGSEVGFAETQPAGTPQYMAPEQKEHRRTDHRADIYSLGVVLYELLTGELPANKLQAPSRKVQIDVRLDEIVLRALERTPELRYQTAGEFRTQLETVAGSPSREAAEAVTELDSLAPTRFSRMAILGALCFLLLPLGLAVNSVAEVTAAGMPLSDRRFGLAFAGVSLLFLGTLGVLAGTILGWFAVCRIRRSAGKLRGLGLAVFDGMLVPLLALDALIIRMDLAGRTHIVGPGLTPGVTMAVRNVPGRVAMLMAAIILLVDFLIIRAVWRRVSVPLPRPSSLVNAAPLGVAPPLAIVALFFAIVSQLVAIVLWIEMPNPNQFLVFLTLGAALLGIALAYPVRRSRLGRSTLTMASISAGVWVAVAIGAPPFIDLFERHRQATSAHLEPGGPESMHVGPPFVAHLARGTVELVGLAPNPAKGAAAWQPDGSALLVPFFSVGGTNTAEGKVMRELAIRVRSEPEPPSTPVVRFAPASRFERTGSSTNWDDAGRTALTHAQAVACPPEANTMDLLVGVAEGAWQTVHTLRKPTAGSSMSGEESSDPAGYWGSSLEYAELKGDVALAFHYSVSTLFETRMALVKLDGSVAELTGNGSNGSAAMLNSIQTLSADEYGQIREFQFQKRPYQWVVFREVSLRPGSHTAVQTVDASGHN